MLMDQMHLLRVFVAVVDANGLAGAARQLGLSPPAVTRAMNGLEGRLGVQLLTRTTRALRLTEAGARYLEDCRRILADLAEADESVSGLQVRPRGQLTVTAPVLFGTLFVTPIVTEYLRCYPEVSVSCWFMDRVVNLVEEGVDVAVRIAELPDSSLLAARVGQVRRVICAAPAYLAQYGSPRKPADLAAHTIISASAVTPQPEWRLVRDGSPCNVRLQPRLTTTTNESAIAAALDGFGLVRLLSYQVAELVRTGQLVIVLDDHEPPPVPVHVVHREGRHASRKVRAFLDLAIQRLRESPALARG
jgi:DNA-binding transcriptional LysR family regulator